MHKISKYLPKGSINKLILRAKIDSIINDYAYKIHKCNRRDFIIRTLIVIVEKYKLNKKHKFINFDAIKKK